MKATRLLSVVTTVIFTACEAGYFDTMAPGDAEGEKGDSEMMGPDGGESGDSEEDNGNSLAGVVTAGEWDDLENWGFWNNLMSGQNEGKFYEYLNYWSLYTGDRFAVTVVDDAGNPVCGAKVELFVDEADKPEWTAISDNQGSAELWFNIHTSIDIDIERTFTAAVNGVKWDGVLIPTYSSADSVRMNTLVSKPVTTLKSADIAFIVDATGSMYDEIDFLKDDLLNIIRRASSGSSVALRTGALFYRDEGDDYVTRIEDFNKDPEKTLKFIGKQEAQGGGDYPEAVHTALEKALQEMSWEEDNYSRLAFLLLDAPPHHQQDVISSLQKSIKAYAANGIKIIPIAASGVDKNTEFILRLMAIFTDGTYTFITNHSGVGGDHIEPTIGDYQVEHLNDLIVRLIKEYTE
ncbi:MAG: VWA domain-containing protein [Bacteroidales bacterium]|nr:VWA domain-containing protein [Bacteroidales bacterium]